MSSFIGHSLAAITVYVATECLTVPAKNLRVKSWYKSDRIFWLACLIIIASIPDLDYVINTLNSSQNQGLRITHSIAFSLIAPCMAIVILLILKSQPVWRRGLQAILAALSHLILDLLVGVTPLPLLFPLIKIPFKLPFGILPSAGKIDLDNYYFYRNLQLEMGVLLPLFIVTCLFGFNTRLTAKNRLLFELISLFMAIALTICASYFVRLNLQLPR